MELGPSDPLNILPYEIWVKCIEIYAREEPEGPLPLLAVSPYWQKRLLEEPKLWTIIHLNGGPDEQCRVECFFQLSRRVLSVEKSTVNNLWVEVVLDRDSSAIDAIIRHKDRIKSLVFGTKTSVRYSSGHIAVLSQTLSVCKYPNLVYIHIGLRRYAVVVVPRNLIEACPALIGIYGAYVEQGNVSLLPRSVIKLGISGDGILYRGVGDHRETLRVHCPITHLDEAGYRDYFTVSTTGLTSFELEFGEHRHSLKMGRPLPLTKGPRLLPIQAFISTSHENLTRLSLNMPWYEVSIITHCLSSCRSLKELELTLSYSLTECQPWNVPPLTVDDMGQVRKLNLAVSMAKYSAESSKKTTATHLALIIQLFAEKDSLRFLENLRLSLPDKDTKQEVLNLLRGAKNLKELSWIGTKPPGTDQNIEKVLLFKLHTLIVQYGSDLQYLDAPNLTCLECHVDLPRVKGQRAVSSHLPSSWAGGLEFISTPTFFLHRWNDLLIKENADNIPFSRVILAKFTGGPFDYQPMVPLLFPNLQSVSFDDRANHTAVGFMREITGDSILNHFLLEMVLSPEVCPRLHTIKSTLYPNWAVAVALFHRRNAVKNVTPIASVWLHGHPQMRILELVMKALGSNGGSIEPITTAIAVDETLCRRWMLKFFRNQACQDCIMSGYISCARTSAQNPAPPDDSEITELLNLDLPADKSPVPITYSREFWEAHLKRTIVAVGEPDTPRCRRHSRRRPEHIGPYTLDGVTCDAF